MGHPVSTVSPLHQLQKCPCPLKDAPQLCAQAQNPREQCPLLPAPYIAWLGPTCPAVPTTPLPVSTARGWPRARNGTRCPSRCAQLVGCRMSTQSLLAEPHDSAPYAPSTPSQRDWVSCPGLRRAQSRHRHSLNESCILHQGRRVGERVPSRSLKPHLRPPPAPRTPHLPATPHPHPRCSSEIAARPFGSGPPTQLSPRGGGLR